MLHLCIYLQFSFYLNVDKSSAFYVCVTASVTHALSFSCFLLVFKMILLLYLTLIQVGYKVRI